ncbi:N(4)-(beta-N-acetylglucosaminyl)-L-asparaginase [Clostridium aestuarii]|uniref:N(4)-(Beta-N-acetylglucosaminyl)-L-asparaginase n=1 Tax=Clostridium aestuarii TaxID=338193 RepID=A0ABT4D3C6_9CLOT|nr:N(4)-(beta-N-acetylglucosaminyl)-L-asparaginase [Clostridium aestuarii]MCY6485745.1 N(4)-(beta-N-acetylglucosaminyl)-L-asparaginase [Clostridium aestuarii]
MKWVMIATWRMAIEGITEAAEDLKNDGYSGEAVEKAIKIVEDFPYYKSVGYGGLPNENCQVELDAAYMDGDTLSIGAIGGITDFKNPISIAKKLSKERFNCFLVGAGADEYAKKEGFHRINMLTDRAKRYYEKRKRKTVDKGLSPYDGHDTVGIISVDKAGKMVVGTSTSGLFMKKKGRVGDSPISGSGFYVDSEVGGATATGLGEDLMKGCISYEIVRLMKDGLQPQEAADKAVSELNEKLIKRRGKSGDISIVALNNKGEWGVSTNIEGFSFSVVSEDEKPMVYVCNKIKHGKTTYDVASEQWLEAYLNRIKSPITFD